MYAGRGPRGGMYPQGYVHATRQDIMVEQTEESAENGGYTIPCMMFGDSRLQLTHEKHVARGKAVDNGQLDASRAGCKGLSIVAKYLSYVDYKNIFLLPAYHSLVYGLCKNFIALIFEVFSPLPLRPVYLLRSDCS
jgi:hypothetical protein